MNDIEFLDEIRNIMRAIEKPAPEINTVERARTETIVVSLLEAARLRDEALKLVLQAAKLVELSIEFDDKHSNSWDLLAGKLENIAVEMGHDSPYPDPLFPHLEGKFPKLTDDDTPS